MNGPFVVLLEQDGADQTGDGAFVRKDADDLGASPDLAVNALDGVGGVRQPSQGVYVAGTGGG